MSIDIRIPCGTPCMGNPKLTDRDFMHHAESDLRCSPILFDNGEYGRAAFSSQQAQEKYLKAYLLNKGLAADAILSHLTYDWIFELLKGNLARYLGHSGLQEPMRTFMQDMIGGMLPYQLLPHRNPELKVIIWKESLDIPLTDHQLDILEGIDVSRHKSDAHMSKFIEKIRLLDTSSSFDSMDQVGDATRRIVDLLSMPDPDISSFVSSLRSIISPTLYGSGAGSLPRDMSGDLVVMINAMQTLKWFGTTLRIYPHEEIGRYPTYIDDRLSDDLYVEHRDKLRLLLDEVEKTCSLIKDEIGPPI